MPTMIAIALQRPNRPIDLILRWVRAGLIPALVFALSGDVMQFEASKECRGALSSGFSGGFDVHRCDLAVRRIGGDVVVRIPIPQR
jgi:hypothetical protein